MVPILHTSSPQRCSIFYALYFFQSCDCGSTLLLTISSPCFSIVLFINLSLFSLLQVQCANCILSISLGCPPFAIGIIWSIQGERGWGYFIEKSTGFPHIPHVVHVANIFFLFLSKAPLCVPSLSGLFLIFHTFLCLF